MFEENLYVEEEVLSNCVYPVEYCVKSAEEQVCILNKFFPLLEYAVKNTISDFSIVGAEGFFIVPKWYRIASNYTEAVQKMLTIFAVEHKLFNWCEEKLSSQFFRQCKKTGEMLT